MVNIFLNGNGGFQMDSFLHRNHYATSPQHSRTYVGGNLVLKIGMQGLAVQKLQTEMIKAGANLSRWGADGFFGNETLSELERITTEKLGYPVNQITLVGFMEICTSFVGIINFVRPASEGFQPEA